MTETSSSERREVNSPVRRAVDVVRGSARAAEPNVGYVATQKYPDMARPFRAYCWDRLHDFCFEKPAGANDIERLEDFVVYVWTRPGDGRVPVHACFVPNDKDYFDQDLDRVKDHTDITLKGVGKKRKFFENDFYVYPTAAGAK